MRISTQTRRALRQSPAFRNTTYGQVILTGGSDLAALRASGAAMRRLDKLLNAKTTYMSPDAYRLVRSSMSLEEQLERFGRIEPLQPDEPERPNEFADLDAPAISSKARPLQLASY